MNVLKHRLAFFSLLILVAFATVAHAQPDGTQPYSSAEWEWALYSIGNHFVDLANNHFNHLVSVQSQRDSLQTAHATPKPTSSVPNVSIDPQLESRPQNASLQDGFHQTSEAGGEAAFGSPAFAGTKPGSFDTQSQAPNYVGVPISSNYTQAPALPNQVAGDVPRNVQQWRPAQSFNQPPAMVPFSSAVQSSAMATPQRPVNMAYPLTNVPPATEQFLSANVPHAFHQPSPQMVYQQPASHNFPCESFADPSLLDNSLQSAPQDYNTDVAANYNFQAGMSEAAGDMAGWLQRASTFGDRVMPRLDTTLLQPPSTRLRNQAPPSPSSASTATSSSRLSYPKRNRTQMTSGQQPFICPRCKAGFRAQGDLTHHLRCHQPYEKRAHQCTQCGRRFQYRKDLIRHLPKHDPNAPRFYCPYPKCKFSTKGFGRQDHLDRHVGTQHRADTPQQSV